MLQTSGQGMATYLSVQMTPSASLAAPLAHVRVTVAIRAHCMSIPSPKREGGQLRLGRDLIVWIAARKIGRK